MTIFTSPRPHLTRPGSAHRSRPPLDAMRPQGRPGFRPAASRPQPGADRFHIDRCRANNPAVPVEHHSEKSRRQNLAQGTHPAVRAQGAHVGLPGFSLARRSGRAHRLQWPHLPRARRCAAGRGPQSPAIPTAVPCGARVLVCTRPAQKTEKGRRMVVPGKIGQFNISGSLVPCPSSPAPTTPRK